MQLRSSVLRAVATVGVIMPGALAGMPSSARAQTDYYNTDKGRPLHTEDAYPVERRAFELQAAPLRLERAAGSVYHWSVEPELAYGILPRTQVEVGVPLAIIDAGGVQRSGMGGVDVSLLYNLNVETSLPALAVSAGALLPVGTLAADEAYVSFKGIATRTLTWARFHLNGEYTIGDEPGAASGAAIDARRWTAGLAVDRTFPLRSLLLGAEVLVQQPLAEADNRTVSIGAGLRYQLSPRWAMDLGAGKQITGTDRPFSVTVGSAYAFGLPWHP